MGSRASISSVDTWPTDQGGPARRSAATGDTSARARATLFVSLAHTLCDAGRTLEAEELCRWVLLDSPRLPTAQTALGRALYESGQLHEAQAVLERAIAEHTGHFAAYRWLAEVLVQTGDWHRAYAVLSQAEVLSPGHARITQLLQVVTGTTPIEPLPEADFDPVIDPYDIPGAQPQADWVRPSAWAQPPRRSREEPPAPRVRVWLSPLRERLRSWGQAGLRPWRRLVGVSRHAAAVAPRRTLAAAAVGTFLVSLTVGVIVRSGRKDPQPRAISSAEAPLAPPEKGAPAVAVITGAPAELAALWETGRPLLAGKITEAVATPVLAAALLATELGRPVDDVVTSAAERLSREPLLRPRQEELGAARVLLLLARGELGAAASLARELSNPQAVSVGLRYAEARVRQRQGDVQAALAALGTMDAASRAFLPARLLRAELALDAGKADDAAGLLRDVLETAPDNPRAWILLLEARRAQGRALSDQEATIAQRLCAAVTGRAPTIEAACLLDRALRARREQRRAEAQAVALRASALAAPEPRVQAQAAELLANLGALDRATALVEAAGKHAAPAFPPLAWASVAVRLGRGMGAVPPSWPPLGPESRLVAVRAAFAEDGAVGVRDVFRRLDRAQVQGDPDLAWFQSLGRFTSPKAGVRWASRLRDRAAPGPVGAFVAGALSRWGGRRHLSALWLRQALEGHGDVCRAADLYEGVLLDLASDPAKDERLKAARARQGCVTRPR